MTAWTTDELTKIGTTEELQIAYLRRDGTLGRPRTIWVVRHGDDLYVRSVKRPRLRMVPRHSGPHEGHVQAGGVSKDVAFADADHGVDDQIDGAYRTKYRRYAANTVNSILTPQARAATLRLAPSS